MATPEQNAEFNRQLKDVLVNNGIALANTSTEGRDKYSVVGEETYKGLLKTIKLLAENTTTTNQIWNNLQSGIQGNTYSLGTHKDKLLEMEARLNTMEKDYKELAERFSTYQIRFEQAERGGFFGEKRKDLEQVDKTIKDHENRLDILNRASKGHAERLNKMEKLK